MSLFQSLRSISFISILTPKTAGNNAFPAKKCVTLLHELRMALLACGH